MLRTLAFLLISKLPICLDDGWSYEDKAKLSIGTVDSIKNSK